MTTTDDNDENTPDSAPDSIEALRHDLTELSDRTTNRHRNLTREINSLAITIGLILAGVIVTIVVTSLWSNTPPTTADDNLDHLLAPGTHCYHSSEEMAAARQRALAAIDRLQWDREHPSTDTSEHGPYYSPPALTHAPPPLPTIVGAKDTGVPQPTGNQTVDTDLCFGIPDNRNPWTN